MSSRRAFLAGAGATVAGSLALTACGAGSRVAGLDVACDAGPVARSTTVQVLAYGAPSIDPFSTAMSVGCSRIDRLRVEHGQIDFSAQLEKARLSLSQPGSGSYDIVEVYSGTIGQYASRGWLAPLDDFVDAMGDRYRMDDVEETFLQACRVDGVLYAFPMVASVHIMVFRRDVLDSLGLAVPVTFAELEQVADRIAQSGRFAHPLALPLGASSAIGAAFNNSLTSLGGSWLTEDGRHAALDTAVAGRALDSLRSLVPFTDPERLTWDQPEVQSSLLNGRAAIGMLYCGRAAAFDDEDKSDFAGSFDYAVPPAVTSGGRPWATLTVDGFALAQNSAVPKELLGQIAASGTGPAAAAEAGPAVYPVRAAVRADPAASGRAPYWPAATRTLRAGVEPYPKAAFFAPLQTAVNPFLALAVDGRSTVSDALARAQQAAEQAIARNGG